MSRETLDQLVEWAEQEGERKQWINWELERKPQYNKLCDCNEPSIYQQDLGDFKMQRIVCLRCGGLVPNV